MTTASLENINAYSKYGLKRRPTYDEIANLISENETLAGTLPDRTATRFKASPEGSFFDGMDSLEILKEQQHRIMERQMRELLMRQNLGGGTYNIARLQQQRRETVQPEVEVQRDRNLHDDASIQTELEETTRRAVEREQQTGEAHRTGGFLGNAVGGATSVIGGLMSGVGGVLNRATSSTTSTPAPPPTQKVKPAPPPKSTPEVIDISTDAENHASNEEFKLSNSTQVNMMNFEKLRIQLFLRGVEVKPDEDIQHLRDMANQIINDGKWRQNISTGQLAKKEKAYQEYKNRTIARGSKGR